MSAIAVVDAHALIWAAIGHKRSLGRRARSFFERVERGVAAAYVPTMVLVEIGEAVWRGAVSFQGGYESWLESLLSSGRYHAVDLTLPIVRRAQQLYDVPERGDRLVVATAIELDCPLVSRDAEIAASKRIDVIW